MKLKEIHTETKEIPEKISKVKRKPLFILKNAKKNYTGISKNDKETQ